MTKRKSLADAAWTTLSSKEIYRNPWLSLREDQVRLPNGRDSIYGVVTCGNCVGVLPFVDERTIVLIKQYRYIAKKVMWEMPTGGVHSGEAIEQAAQRELGEEVGYQAGKLIHLSSFHTSKSVMDETAHLFIGKDLSKAVLSQDETEFIEVCEFPFEQALQMVLSGEIMDAMTIIGVLGAARMKGL